LNNSNGISEQVTVTGWGTTEFGGKATDNLLAVDVKIINFEKCKQIYGTNVNDNGNICAGGDGERDSCQGDSGGPLIHEHTAC